MCVFVCTHVDFEAVIEMFVCASDGATGWQDGGPSLTGKPEQEEQTPYYWGQIRGISKADRERNERCVRKKNKNGKEKGV